MIVIPAIDLKNGKCVRLVQGNMDQETVYSDNPLQMARRWEKLGAELLHLVDLDGAVEGTPKNLDLIQEMVKGLFMPVEVGGGIRSLETIDSYIRAGAMRVVIGTRAVEDPDFLTEACRRFPGKILAGIDARNGYVAVHGWTKVTERPATDLAREIQGQGVSAVIFTDIHRDGMQTGPNIESTRALAESISIPVIASGGISSLEDVRALMRIEPCGVIGAITGRALYTGALDLREAMALTKRGG
ncbi:MAG: 1-(5-phosphoribosyl)-5-[(5-phosphoribosylamino)methylideneamino]imidazole-4-carboxamide isomerase [Nitrospirae bacterium CG_4_9_14_3_um_filter_53_35]|nr:MAG: 1-(5-phosphoribosyl)-5-[(5-phosphoribosylamino)methylideneamino]imidazole-4-carboxamide isomerase [Nitrospirae bacterium CG2_30_53_67]PIS37880.1 MAG: 1-(5-phosphoribosyl)-5-[(5-phosphoribosylamino)methylideneamino]imidazole-4-carboxamide isomerase [Nitrospirae bacterium CG08_land_8_20_14_0_20_52_24]PIW84855.1 MAG: 1-(5-phosphoribosyl)-5-[(5-phosphoribosylamino)methylideneamino]imidazole-4-carboxamide isomerase [Nitrospirae bacterium CG_4_8_14_3_um_filter_50_41]PIX87068.1 MAG: 1-(5-phosph